MEFLSIKNNGGVCSYEINYLKNKKSCKNTIACLLLSQI